MRNHIFCGLVIMSLSISCQMRDVPMEKVKPERYGFVTGIKPEKIAYYKELHAKPWEGVLQALTKNHVQNYSIYIQEIEGKHYLFGYYEYTGKNYEKDMRRIAQDSITRQWWKETDPCQIPLSKAAAQDEIWTEMEEVFHMN